MKKLAKILVGVILAGGMTTAFASTANVVYGTPGNDVIRGNKLKPAGAQIIYAKAGNDRVWGGRGSDTEYGGYGNDTLHGYQAGADTLIGGPGYDTCVIGFHGNYHTNDSWRSCERVVYRRAQGHGSR